MILRHVIYRHDQNAEVKCCGKKSYYPYFYALLNRTLISRSFDGGKENWYLDRFIRKIVCKYLLSFILLFISWPNTLEQSNTFGKKKYDTECLKNKWYRIFKWMLLYFNVHYYLIHVLCILVFLRNNLIFVMTATVIHRNVTMLWSWQSTIARQYNDFPIQNDNKKI